MSELVRIIIFSVVAIIFLFIISKLLGKKQVAQLEFIDYTIGISLGSIAAEMSTQTDNPWYYYIIAMSIFFFLDIAVSYLGRLTPWTKKFFKGQPIMVIKDGKFDYKQLKRSKLDVNDVLGLCRTEGYFNIDDVAYAVFEINGELSVMPKGVQKPTVISDFKIEPEKSSLNNYLIIDGNVVSNTLNRINKTKDWLFTRIGIQDKKDIKKILLCDYNIKQDNFTFHYKSCSDNNYNRKTTININKKKENNVDFVKQKKERNSLLNKEQNKKHKNLSKEKTQLKNSKSKTVKRNLEKMKAESEKEIYKKKSNGRKHKHKY